jgi:small multidrug resistance pump
MLSLCAKALTPENTMHNALLLGSAIVAEIIATSALKASYGFSKLWPSVLTVLAYAIAFYLLSQTLKRMEIGVVYAIWSGAGTAAMALVGYWLFNESLDTLKLVSIGFIVAGVVGLNAGDLLPLSRNTP